MKYYLFLLLLIVQLFYCSQGLAAQNPPEITLDEIVVTGSRYGRELKTLPGDIQVISRKEIESSTATTVPDVLRNVTGISVIDSIGNGTQAMIDIRGFGDGSLTRTLILIDGRRINLADMTAIKWLQIPLDRVERIEVMRGPGSVLYGDNAVGGVVNIITRAGTAGITAQAGIIYGSYDRLGSSASISGREEALSFFLNADYDESDGYRENSGFRSKNVGVNLGYDLASCFHLAFSAGRNDSTFGLPGYLTEQQMNADRRQSAMPSDNAKATDNFANLGGALLLTKWGEFDLNLLYRYNTQDSNMASWPLRSEADFRTFAITPKYVLQNDIIGHKNKLVAGLDYYRIKMNQDSFSFTDTQDKLDKTSAGYYFQEDFFLIDRLILTLGYRYERAKFKFLEKSLPTGTVTADSSLQDKQEAASAGLSFVYGHNSSIFARWDRTYRFPATDEYFTWGNLITDLRPEHGYSYELGVRHVFSPGIEAGLTGFRINMKDEISYNAVTMLNQNLDDTRHQGFELSGRTKLFKNLSLSAGYTYTDVKFTAGPNKDHKVPLIPQNKINAGLIVDLPYYLQLDLKGIYVGKRYFGGDFQNSFDKLSDHTTFDAKLAWRHKKIDAFLAVNNIFNKKYSELAYFYNFSGPVYYPMPERNYLAGVSYRF